jgi:hypothetical protein
MQVRLFAMCLSVSNSSQGRTWELCIYSNSFLVFGKWVVGCVGSKGQTIVGSQDFCLHGLSLSM